MSLRWLQNFDEALIEAGSKQRPLLIFNAAPT
jgi:hypothetical protein